MLDVGTFSYSVSPKPTYVSIGPIICRTKQAQVCRRTYLIIELVYVGLVLAIQLK